MYKIFNSVLPGLSWTVGVGGFHHDVLEASQGHHQVFPGDAASVRPLPVSLVERDLEWCFRVWLYSLTVSVLQCYIITLVIEN